MYYIQLIILQVFMNAFVLVCFFILPKFTLVMYQSLKLNDIAKRSIKYSVELRYVALRCVVLCWAALCCCCVAVCVEKTRE